jgi:hypothetical protein
MFFSSALRKTPLKPALELKKYTLEENAYPRYIFTSKGFN